MIIDFSSLKKCTIESSRPPPLVSPTLSLQYHRQSLITVTNSVSNWMVSMELEKWRFNSIAVEIEKGRPKIYLSFFFLFISSFIFAGASKNQLSLKNWIVFMISIWTEYTSFQIQNDLRPPPAPTIYKNLLFNKINKHVVHN